MTGFFAARAWRIYKSNARPGFSRVGRLHNFGSENLCKLPNEFFPKTP